MGENNPFQQRTDRPARKWRGLSVGAGLLLAACFFMPAVQGCNTPIVPARDLANGLRDLDWNVLSSFSKVLEVVAGVAMFSTAYLFGLLMAAAAVSRLAKPDREAPGRVSLAIAWLLLGVIALAELAAWVGSVQDGFPNLIKEWPIALWGFGTPLIFFIFTLIALRRRQEFSWLLGGCVAGLIWFGFFIITDGGLYGLHLSVTACVLLAIATAGEAKAITRQGWWRTLWQLLRCRLAGPADLRGRCPQCDYLLTGLPEPRCPECGRAFTWEEVGMESPLKRADVDVVAARNQP